MPFREEDHDILIELQRDVKWLREFNEREFKTLHSMIQELREMHLIMDQRVNKLEDAVSFLKGRWSILMLLLGGGGGGLAYLCLHGF
ncbi:MAG: hypothetical protein ACXQTL_04875 [Methanosarcinales archaeon]